LQQPVELGNSLWCAQDLCELMDEGTHSFQIDALPVQREELLDVVSIPISPGERLVNDESSGFATAIFTPPNLTSTA
jgi:hypothetical protein